jgi:DNA repair exonuclease SbcCD nuclease subunit
MAENLFFTDIHIHSHKKSTDRLEDCLKVLEWVFKTAIKRNAKNVIFLGDLFHDRSKIEVLTLFKVYEVFEKYLGHNPPFKLWLLLGNHDLWNRDNTDVYSPRVLSNFVHIIDKPCALEIDGFTYDFLPFTENPLDDLKMLAEARPKAKGEKRVLCAHLAIDGAELNTFGTLSDVIVEQDGDMVPVGVEKLDHWDKVWLGHYHGTQVLANGTVEYVGSPLQLSKSEAFQQKHIIAFNTCDMSVEYIVNDFSPVHLILKPQDVGKYKLAGNFITIKTDGMSTTDVADLRKSLVENNALGSLDIKPCKKKSHDESHVVEDAKAIIADEQKMLEVYIKQTMPPDLEYELLLRTGRMIVEKANQGK